MIKRSSGSNGSISLLDKNRVTNFLRRHEAGYLERAREFLPFVAISSIQATIVGLAFAAFTKWWLAASFAFSIFILGALVFFLILRRRVFRLFDRSAIKLLMVSGQSVDQLESLVRESIQRFPRAATIVHRQLIQLSPADLRSFQQDRDFVTLIDKLDKIPEV